MKLISIFIFILSCRLAALGQNDGSLQGTVTLHGRPVAGAAVTVTPKDATVPYRVISTDGSGEYSFDLLRTGEYTVAASITESGVLRSSARVTIAVSDGQVREVQLDLSGAIYEQVTVSANSPQSIEQVSKTVDVIDGQEMRDRGDFTLVDSLRSIPGFRVQQLGGFGRTASIKARGLRNQDTAILIDGIRFRDASSITGDASAFLSDFTLTNVSRVEVLRGSGSSLYGTNAIGGTINFQTPGPTRSLHGQLSIAAGGLGLRRLRGNISDGTADGRFGFTLGVSRTAYTSGIDGDDNSHNANFQNRIEYAPTPKSTISARFFVSDAFVRLNAGPDTAGTPPGSNFGFIRALSGINFVYDADDPDDTQKSQFFDAQVVFTQAFGKDLFFEGTYSGLRTSRKNENGILGPGFQSASTSIFSGTIQTLNGRLSWTPNAIHQITTGYEFETEKFGNDGFTPNGVGNFFSRAGQTSNTIYVQDLVQLFDRRLQLSGGARAQFFQPGDPRFSLRNAPYAGFANISPPMAYTFDGSASYNFATGLKLRAHAGNGYRVPSLYERYGTFFSSFGGAAFVALGDPELKPERSIAFDAAVEQELFESRIRLTATYFYSRLLRTIDFGSIVRPIGSTTRPFGGYLNSEGAIARGTELSVSFKPCASTTVSGSYTFTNSDQRTPQVSGSGILTSLGIPDHQFTLVATQRLGRFWVNADLLASSSYFAPIFSTATFNSYVYRFKGNRRLDLTAGYTFPLDKERMSLRIFGTIENVLGNRYFENGFRTPGRNSRAAVSFTF